MRRVLVTWLVVAIGLLGLGDEGYDGDKPCQDNYANRNAGRYPAQSS
jgi:hypothetical protein